MQTKNAVITRSSRRSRITRATAFRRSCTPTANALWTTPHPAIFSESSFSTLSDFLILSVATRAFSNRAD
jgi:hypothetical protein